MRDMYGVRNFASSTGRNGGASGLRLLEPEFRWGWKGEDNGKLESRERGRVWEGAITMRGKRVGNARTEIPSETWRGWAIYKRGIAWDRAAKWTQRGFIRDRSS